VVLTTKAAGLLVRRVLEAVFLSGKRQQAAGC
jgi:hypothetical protein